MSILRSRGGEQGYNLVVLVVAITVLHIVLAASVPLWSTQIRREREAEAIFRGLQYAEAIRVFQQRFGRYPTTKEELLEVEPRSIRQLWTDPLSAGGELGFGVLIPAGAQGGPAAQGGRRRGGSRNDARGGAAGRQPTGRDSPADVVSAPASGSGQQALLRVAPGEAPSAKGGRRGGRRRAGAAPIRGVYLATEGESIRIFMGASSYSEWVFTDTMLPVPSIPDPAAPLPSANSDRVGRVFDVPISELDNPSTQGKEEREQKRRRRRQRRQNDDR